jgi:cytochrome c1
MSLPRDDTHAGRNGGHIPVLPLILALVLILITAAGWLLVQTWQQRQENLAVARALTGGDPDNAAALVTRFGCGGCHTIPGLPGAQGKVAPPLTDLRSRVYIAGVLPNTAENLIGWIVDPRAFSPRTAMPMTGITKEEARDIAAYLYAQ